MVWYIGGLGDWSVRSNIKSRADPRLSSGSTFSARLLGRFGGMQKRRNITGCYLIPDQCNLWKQNPQVITGRILSFSGT